MNRVGTSWCFIMQESSYLLIISESNEVGYERGGYFLKSVFFFQEDKSQKHLVKVQCNESQNYSLEVR